MSAAALKEALRDNLERRGVCDQLRARIRSEIFTSLSDPEDVRPSLSEPNRVVNELIREYLAFNGYGHTLSVFLPESGQPVEPLPRNVLAQQTSLTPTAGDLPLLYSACQLATQPAMQSSMPPLPQAASVPENFAPTGGVVSHPPSNHHLSPDAPESTGGQVSRPTPAPVIFSAPPLK